MGNLLLNTPGHKVRFLQKDVFSIDESAPLTSPRTCVPGPGQLTIVDTENKLSISGGKLVCAGGRAVPAYGDPIIYGSVAFTRAVGLATLCGFKPVTMGSTLVGIGNGTRFRFGVGSFIPSWLTGYVTGGVGSYAVGTEYNVACIARGVGGFYIIDGKLLWVNSADADASQSPHIDNYNAQYEARNFRIIDLSRYDARFATDNGLATSVLTAPATGATFTHTADGLLEWNFTFAATNTGSYTYRKTDANNLWRLDVAADGGLILYQRAGGVDTARYTGAAATISAAAHRIVLIVEGNVHKVYLDNTLMATYTDATNQGLTATDGLVAYSGLTVASCLQWPRTVTLPGGI